MERGNGTAGTAKRGGHLHEAAGIAARVRVGLRGEHMPRLAVAELGRRPGLDDVVDTGAAAADVLDRKSVV